MTTTQDTDSKLVFKVEPTKILAPAYDGKIQVESKLDAPAPQKTSGYPWFAKPNRDAPFNPADLANLVPGETYDITYVRENLKKGKSGGAMFDYHWGIWQVDTAGEGPVIDTPTLSARQNAPTAPTGPSVDTHTAVATHITTGDEIINQVLTKIAAKVYIGFPEAGEEQAAITAVNLWNHVRLHRHGIPIPELTVQESAEQDEGAEEPVIGSNDDAWLDVTAVSMLGYDWYVDENSVWFCDDVIQDNGSTGRTALGVHVADVVAASTKSDFPTVLGQLTKRYNVGAPKITPAQADEFIRSKGVQQ